jgi:hypothetical protein
MARREPNPAKALEVSVMFEPNRLSPACVVQAYEQVVPLTQRTASGAAHQGFGGRKWTVQPVGRRAAS